MNDPILTPEQIAHNQRPLTKKEILILDLEDARGYIKRGWNQGCSAVDDKEECVSPDNPKAVSWCILGACDVAGKSSSNSDLMAKLIRLANNRQVISLLNDRELKTQEEAIVVFDKTIEYVKTNINDDLSTLI